MATLPEPVKIKRIGLVLEMEDGAKVMVYADQLDRAEVTITRVAEPLVAWDQPSWLPHMTRAYTSILIEGLEAYRITETPPEARVSFAGRQLEAMRREIR